MLGGVLWRHRDFLKLWTGETVSEFGTQVSQLAIPTVAILILHANPFQVGILSALEFLAFPTLGLVAGVYADRIKRRPIMIVCDVGRLVALGSIPVAFAVGVLTLTQLYLVALVAGIFTVFFDVSYQSYLPVLVDRPNLIEGNTKLEVTRSGSQIAGPAVAGFLIQLIGGARAVAVDAASYLVSALALTLIRKPEPAPKPGTESGKTGFLAEMREGIAVVFRNPLLWRIAGCTATSNLGSSMIFGAVYLIFAYRDLHLSAGIVGLVFGISSVGYLVGALLASSAARTLGLGRTLVAAITVAGLATLSLPLALIGAPALVLSILGFVSFMGSPVYNINQVSLRQTITPDRAQGRMNATMRTIVWGTMPIGSLIGGILGATLGVVQTLVLGGIVSTLAVVWILLGPVVGLERQPDPVAA